MNQTHPAVMKTSTLKLRVASLGVALAIALGTGVPAVAAPGTHDSPSHAAFQNVDYISSSSGAALDLGFTVLVPGWVPAPFGGEPSIDAGGGYYSLYWMNAGGDPTFLQVTGQVGGGLPSGSPYDLNVELFINASVQGYEAIHDVTPNYDAVWWIAGGVLYKVEGRNAGVDSLTLANSLIAFAPPSAPEPVPTDPPVVEEPEQPVEEPVEEPVDNSGGESSGESTTSEKSSQGSGTSEGGSTSSESSGSDSQTSESQDAPLPTVVPTGTDGTGQPSVTSDGTGGAQVRVIGSDGTGGTSEVVVPRRNGAQVP